MRAAEVEDEFLFGPDLLVAPIIEYQARERRVYLPAGAEWTEVGGTPGAGGADANAGTYGVVRQGGATIDAAAPIERIPVFVRGRNSNLVELFQRLYEL